MLVRVRAPDGLLRVTPGNRVRNGRRVAFRGDLRVAAGRRGVLVEMQARRGLTRQTFGTATTRCGGHFRWSYRFAGAFGAVRHQFRAHIRAESSLPGTSRRVKVIKWG